MHLRPDRRRIAGLAAGSEIRTSNIDALAAGGLRYNHVDTKAVCSPTRAALLTGRNPQTVRMADLPAKVLIPTDMTRDRGELPQNTSTVVWEPGTVPSNTVNPGRIRNLDFAPTFLDVAGARRPQQFRVARSPRSSAS